MVETDAQAETRDEFLRRLQQLAPFDGQLQIPDVRAGIVARPELVARLAAADAAPVVVFSAATGYGKTSLLAEWAGSDPRPFAWLSLTESQNDPIALVAYIARALDAVEPLDLATLAALTRSGADLSTTLLPRLGGVLKDRATPVVLVLDDVHLLVEGACGRVISTLADHLAPASQLALAGRIDPPLLVSRLRSQGRLLRLTVADLSLSAAESGALVEAAGLHLAADARDRLVGRADGWPAGLYLASIAIRGGGDVDAAARAFGGDDRVVAELLRDEVFPTLPDATVEFLLRTSVLERASGSLCDAMLDRAGSGELLEAIARSNLFLVPLDRNGEWYRYHHLFRDLLRAELRRRDAGVEPGLHERASAWYEERGDLDAAIRHAWAAGCHERAAALIWSHTAFFLSTGRGVLVRRWLDLFPVEEISAVPELALAAACCALTSRHIGEIEFWTVAAERAGDDHVLADGRSVRGVAALLRASVGRDGLTRTAEDAALAYELDREGSAFRATARYIEGAAYRLLGDTERARALQTEAFTEAGPAVPTVATQALAQLAMLDLDDNWDAAERNITRARAIVRELDLRDHPAQVLVYALSAFAFARRGETDQAVRDLLQARGLLGNLGDILPWLAIEARIVLARASLLLGDVATGRLLLHEAESSLERIHDAGTLPDRVEHAKKVLDESTLTVGVIAAPLTTAEMRVLRYLPTHLTLAAIAEELYVSRNTAKTHAIAVYRKLGVSSRQAAVQQARALGLLDDDR